MTTESTPAKKSIPAFRSGDTVKVFLKLMEGDNERIQAFEGIVLRRRGGGNSETFTVRKISFGVGVERTFPVNSPQLDRIEVTKSAKVRRSRLYYLRALSGKSAKLNEQEAPAAQAAQPKADAKAAAASPNSKAGHVEGHASAKVAAA